MCQENGHDTITKGFEEYGCIDPSHAFNLAVMTCIPKAPAGRTDNGEDCLRPEDTRPVCIVDTANRLLASAIKIKWEPHINQMVSLMQKGSLKQKKSMLSNVVKVEHEGMLTSLRSSVVQSLFLISVRPYLV